SVRRLDAVFESSAVARALLDADFHLLSVNAAYAAFLNRSREELIGHRPLEFTHPDDLEIGFPEYNDLRNGTGRRTPGPVEKRYLLPNGSIAWGRLHLAIVS